MISGASEPRQAVIIDTDPGVDDAIAILLALAYPGFDVIGLTTTAGNVPRGRATRNALALLDYVGRNDIPVHAGAARPVRGKFAYARHVHSPAGLTRRLPDPVTPPSNVGAVRFLAQSLLAEPNDVTVIALGPLTNLARLLKRNSRALQSAKRIVIMGGAVNFPGNATTHSEFNFFSDPTAARLVLESGIPVTLVDLAACRQVYLTRADAISLSSANPFGKLAAELVSGWFNRDAGRRKFPMYDPLAVVAAIEARTLDTHPLTLAVDDAETTDDSSQWGRCTVVSGGDSNVLVAKPDGVDARLALQTITDLLDWNRAPVPTV